MKIIGMRRNDFVFTLLKAKRTVKNRGTILHMILTPVLEPSERKYCNSLAFMRIELTFGPSRHILLSFLSGFSRKTTLIRRRFYMP